MLLFNLPFMGVRTSLWCNELINRYNFTDIPEKKKDEYHSAPKSTFARERDLYQSWNREITLLSMNI